MEACINNGLRFELQFINGQHRALLIRRIVSRLDIYSNHVGRSSGVDGYGKTGVSALVVELHAASANIASIFCKNCTYVTLVRSAIIIVFIVTNERILL